MGKIVNYPIDTIPALNDKVIGTDVSDGNKTKNFLISDILALGGGGGGSSIQIPKLTLQGHNVKDTSIYPYYPIRDTLKGKWVSPYNTFLNYNPEVWVFNYNAHPRTKMYNSGDYHITDIRKNWKHESHLKGIKYPNGAFYSGQVTNHFAPFVNTYGRHTEFICSHMNDQWFDIGMDIYEWVFGNTFTDEWVKMSDSDDFALSYMQIVCREGRRSETFRFAIVIDNPDTTSPNPKLIGELSDEITLKSTSFPIQRFTWGLRNRYIKMPALPLKKV